MKKISFFILISILPMSALAGISPYFIPTDGRDSTITSSVLFTKSTQNVTETALAGDTQNFTETSLTGNTSNVTATANTGGRTTFNPPKAGGFFPLVSYKLTAPIAGFNTYQFGSGLNNEQEGYLYKIYQWSIRAVIVLVVYQIIYGGITYVTSASGYIENDGRERIQSALIGLGLTLGSYLILRTINPDLVNFQLIIPPIRVSAKRTASVTSQADYGAIDQALSGELLDRTQGISYVNTEKSQLTEAQIAEIDRREEENRKRFAAAGIGINSKYGTADPKNPCPPGVSFRNVIGGCTSTAGLNGYAISGTTGIKQECPGCTVTITGGSEEGHKTHSEGNRVDLAKDPTLDAYFLAKFATENGSGAKPTLSPSGKYKIYNLGKYTVMDEGNHWHVTFQIQ